MRILCLHFHHVDPDKSGIRYDSEEEYEEYFKSCDTRLRIFKLIKAETKCFTLNSSGYIRSSSRKHQHGTRARTVHRHGTR